MLDEMRENIYTQLREYWDAGIRGPDFVWAATGPALEAYSKHPVVKKANEPDATMAVSEFLRAVRRLVVDFVVGRVLTQTARQPPSAASTMRLPTICSIARTSGWMTRRSALVYCTRSHAAFPITIWPIGMRYSRRPAARPSRKMMKRGAAVRRQRRALRKAAAARSACRPWNRRIRKSMGYDGDGGTAAASPLR